MSVKKLTDAQKFYLQGNAKAWKQLTFENEHTEVRIRIAHCMNVFTGGEAATLVTIYEAINREQERRNNLTRMLRNLRDATDQELYEFIKEHYGEDVFKQIHECL